MTRLQAHELPLRTLPHDQLAHAGPERAASDDLGVGTQRPCLIADTAHLHAALIVRRTAFYRQIGGYDNFARSDRLPCLSRAMPGACSMTRILSRDNTELTSLAEPPRNTIAVSSLPVLRRVWL